MKQLSPRSVWMFFIQDIFGFVFLFFFVFIFFGFTFITIFLEKTGILDSLPTAAILIIVFLIILTIFSYFWARLQYKFYKYELREDGFRKESGVILKKYVTIPYERIQNVDIYRGIIARILGLSDLHIQTAGNSAVSGRFGINAEGRLPGITVQDAEQIRDELVRRSKGIQNQQAQQLVQNVSPQSLPQSSTTQQGL
jgi:uncharacterized membrane protein YdbT with pleckstrin-like domain